MDIRLTTLEPNGFYHIFNRGINGECVFADEENYHFFLSKMTLFLVPYFDIYAYCLMPNHFHLLLSPIENDEIHNFRDEGLHSAENMYSKQIAKLISSYTQSFNKYQKRHGQLFESPFKRIEIKDEKYLLKVLIYIHQNPLRFVQKPEDYKFSSYKAIISDQKTAVNKDSIRWFENIENFIFCHQKMVDLEGFQL